MECSIFHFSNYIAGKGANAADQGKIQSPKEQSRRNLALPVAVERLRPCYQMTALR